MTAYYNEFDPHAAQWLRNLIAANLIAPGEMDERSIEDVAAADLLGFSQHHFFAGIGTWSYCLRQARWPDDRPVWTGSPPCQPFSAAGQGKGTADARHLWPAFYWLLRQHAPSVLFGEQVASPDALAWLDNVQSDMEAAGYAFAALDTCAPGFGAPHIRQRLLFNAVRMEHDESFGRNKRGPESGEWSPLPGCGPVFVADSDCARHEGLRGLEQVCVPAGWGAPERYDSAPRSSVFVEHSEGLGRVGRQDDVDSGRGQRASGQGSAPEWLGDASGGNAGAERQQRGGEHGQQPGDSGACGLDHGGRPGPTNGYWRDADWLFCTDGKWRPVEPGTFPLVDGTAFKLGSGSSFAGKSRAKMLKGYGGAIVAPQATAFIKAAMELMP